MRLDTLLLPQTALKAIPEMARAAEALGFAGLWAAETQHNPFLACALVAEHTERMQFGTAIAVSFARSPAVLAHTAWDLSQASGGRFLLGLGTQVRAHIERRFGMPWPASPVGKLREQLAAVRAFWRTWQTGERLNVRGEYYKLTLSTPFFSPDPIEQPDIPIYIAGVNTGLARLAGEAADGFQVHPLHTRHYLKEVLLPAIEAGARQAGRGLEDVSLAVNAFVVTNDEEREQVRRQISFYASTPSYRPVLAQHGWEQAGERLSRLAARGRWDEMPDLVSEAMLAEIATQAAPGDLAAALRERYGGIADRLTVYSPFTPSERQKFWKAMVKGFEGG